MEIVKAFLSGKAEETDFRIKIPDRERRLLQSNLAFRRKIREAKEARRRKGFPR